MSLFSKKFIFTNLAFLALVGGTAVPAYGMMTTVAATAYFITRLSHEPDCFEALSGTTPRLLEEVELACPESRTRMHYQYGVGYPLYATKEELISWKNDPHALRELFEKQGVSTAANLFSLTESWSNEEHWSTALELLTQRAEHSTELSANSISITELLQLLQDAKSILRSFLATDPDRFKGKPRNAIRKSGINRLFAYAKLQEVIERKNLSHIHLPIKKLVIEDTKKNCFVKTDTAFTLIDHLVKTYVIDPDGVTVRIDDVEDTDYRFVIFAEKKPKHTAVPLSNVALEELAQLIEEAPFDVGYDNIFSTPEGDAVIIDTEYKGEPAESSIEKLQNYRRSR